MITQLATVKERLGIEATDLKDDAILTRAIEGLSERFDRECGRRLGRVVDAVEEFGAGEVEVCPASYPIESVSRFELKTNEVEGWVEQSGVEFVVRRGCVISLEEALGEEGEVARVVYTGGYVLPGTVVGAGQTALPADVEQAAVEQVVFWYQTRDHVGVLREWPKGGIYQEFADIDLTPSVRSVLGKYTRVKI